MVLKVVIIHSVRMLVIFKILFVMVIEFFSFFCIGLLFVDCTSEEKKVSRHVPAMRVSSYANLLCCFLFQAMLSFLSVCLCFHKKASRHVPMVWVSSFILMLHCYFVRHLPMRWVFSLQTSYKMQIYI